MSRKAIFQYQNSNFSGEFRGVSNFFRESGKNTWGSKQFLRRIVAFGESFSKDGENNGGIQYPNDIVLGATGDGCAYSRTHKRCFRIRKNKWR